MSKKRWFYWTLAVIALAVAITAMDYGIYVEFFKPPPPPDHIIYLFLPQGFTIA